MNISPKEKRTIETREGIISYFLYPAQKEAAPTVFLLHGLSSNHTSWDPMVDMFLKIGMHVIAPDLRGHGHSDKTRERALYDISNFAEDIRLIIEQEQLSSVHIVGYSFGGTIGLEYASRQIGPLDSLVLISTTHRKPFARTWKDPLVSLFGYTLIALGYAVWWQKRKWYHYFEHGKAKGYWDATFTGLATMPLSINFWMLSNLLRVDFDSSLSRITVPVLLVYGDNDPYVTVQEIERMYSQIPDVEKIILNDSSHFLVSQHTGSIMEKVQQFIEKHT